MRKYVALAAVVLAAVVVAWLIRFACDDAYISYVYARNLIYGDGLTWFGTHIEGYTNFAWVLWVAGGLSIGLDPLVWSWIGSLSALAVTLVLIHRLAELRTSSRWVALCVVALLATNYTFLAFATSGLETMAQCALLTAAYYRVEKLRRTTALPHPRELASLSVIAALALWTRLDSAVYLAVIGVAATIHLVRARATIKHWIAALAPAVVLVGGWLAWKLAYYGDILPNTFYAKAVLSTGTVVSAMKFTAAFFHAYVLWAPLSVVLVVSLVRRAFPPKLPLLVVVVWIAYVIAVGGDFMEFRFFVATMPLLFLVIAEVLVGAEPALRIPPVVRAVVLVAWLLPFSVRHARRLEGAADNTWDTVHMLKTFYGVLDDGNWSELGTTIGDVLADANASIACNGAGAIPYFSDLPTIDQMGLNDAWIARHGARPPPQYTRPGHQRFATQEYLTRRGVTFVLGSPYLVERGVLRDVGFTRGVQLWLVQLLGPTLITADPVLVVAAPVRSDRSILMWYLTPTPEITQRIRAAGWETLTLHRKPSH